MKNYRLIAKTFSGLEYVLADELRTVGARNIKPGNRATYFEGSLKTVYAANYRVRTALRILREIKAFQFKNVEQFYLQCKRIRWSDIMDVNHTFVINSTVIQSRDFRNSMFASLKVKDAIVDYFRESVGKRPSVNTDDPDVIIDVHIHKDTCTLSLDSSGESLHKRGYRVKQGDAPLNEVLAAGMIRMSGWTGKTDFVDPMCGSGTLPVEAALIAQNIPAGKFRKSYAFENWKEHDPLLWEEVKASVEKTFFEGHIYASDINAGNLLNAQSNARRALVFNKIQFRACDMRDLDLQMNNATIIINPPYGERLKEKDLPGLYAMIGERLKHRFNGNEAWILTSSTESMKHIGLRPSEKFDLYNGALLCKFNRYKLFSGKLKN